MTSHLFTDLDFGRGFGFNDLSSADLLVDLVELGEFVASDSLSLQHQFRVNAFRCSDLNVHKNVKLLI